MKRVLTAVGFLGVLGLSAPAFGAVAPSDAIQALKEVLHPGTLHGTTERGNPCSVETAFDGEGRPSISVVIREQDVSTAFLLSNDPRFTITRLDKRNREMKIEAAQRRGMNGFPVQSIRIVRTSAGDPAFISVSLGRGMASPYSSCDLGRD